MFALLTATTARAEVEINETNFPDANFRGWVLANSFGQDGVLTDEEIASVTRIDLNTKGIQSLKGIEFFTELTWLLCINNPLTEIDLSKCTKLTHLECAWTQITELDVSNNTALTTLNCQANQLTVLDVSKNTALVELSCNMNQLTSLDVSKNIALTKLLCSDNQLTELDMSKNTELKTLECITNQLTSLDVSGLTMLDRLACARNELTKLDVSDCVNLRELFCCGNQIRGGEMDLLVQSLPDPKRSVSHLYVIDYQDEGNTMTKAQVEKAKAKRWKPYYADGMNNWTDYEGSDGVTGIASPFKDTEEGALYNLAGQRISKPQRGINIVNGKKVLVK